MLSRLDIALGVAGLSLAVAWMLFTNSNDPEPATTGAVGLPLYCVLAVAFGVYIAIYQWQLISSSN